MKLVVTGSYAGQDSLGDECLLKAVLERLQFQRPDAEIEVQLNDPRKPFIAAATKELRFTPRRGLQYSMVRFAHVLKRLRVPAVLADAVGQKGVGAAAAIGVFEAGSVMRRLKDCDAFFIFGGTQFSGQWFRLNSPAYLKSAEIVRSRGGKVFFGPQQYGPFSDEDLRTLRTALGEVVNDWRTRNSSDAEFLEACASKRAERLAYDEVFSAVRLYPSLPPLQPTHLLFNLRNSTFVTDDTLGGDAFKGFTGMVDALVQRYRLPAVFFSVSNETFCDDDAAFSAVRERSKLPQDSLRNIGRVRDEYQLFNLARHARATVSMSFHGCLLSGIAGAPFVPVTEGSYYDYKYVDFDKYTGGQGTPLISLSECDPERDSRRIAGFVDRFHHEAVVGTRMAASDLTDRFYRNAIGSLAAGRAGGHA